MHKLYSTSQEELIVYQKHKVNNTNLPYVIFLHGLMSNMFSTKALYLMDYCQKNNYNFIKFDNFGHGNSSGTFIDQTISLWLSGIKLVLDNLVEDNGAILIGSSVGGWLGLISALKFPNKIKGLINLAPAADFTENIWNGLSLAKQNKLRREKILEIASRNCQDKYQISYKLIEDAKNYLLLIKDKINIDIPVHLIHGMLDADVPYDTSIKLFKKITSTQLVIKLIKDGDHKLSREQDLKIITNSLEEIMGLLIVENSN